MAEYQRFKVQIPTAVRRACLRFPTKEDTLYYVATQAATLGKMTIGRSIFKVDLVLWGVRASRDSAYFCNVARRASW